MRVPRVYRLARFRVKLYFRASVSRDEETRHSIGKDFLDLGGGNSRSRSERFSLVQLQAQGFQDQGVSFMLLYLVLRFHCFDFVLRKSRNEVSEAEPEFQPLVNGRI
jgi:hypothetical protein